MPVLLFLIVGGGALLYYGLAVHRGESHFRAALFAILLGPFALPLLWRTKKSDTPPL